MDPKPGLRIKILLVPMKILVSLLRGSFSCVSKKADCKRLEFTKLKWEIIQITKDRGVCGAVPQVYSSYFLPNF